MVFCCVSVLLVCLFVFSSSLPAVSVVSSSRGSKPFTPRRYLGTEENRHWEGARSRGEEKWEQTDAASVASASAMGKKNGKNKRKKTKTRMRYVTNAAADGEDGERLGRENAMSRLIRLIGNLGAADFQGFVFFCGGRCQNHGASQKGLRQPENK